MASRFLLAILVACLVAAPRVAFAQVPGGDVTFKVPVNLTKLSADIAKVRVSCVLFSDAMTAVNHVLDNVHRSMVSTEIPAVNGQAVGTATVVFSNFTLTNPAGATAGYLCELFAIDKAGKMGGFGDNGFTAPYLRVTPAPMNITGTFAW
jgi:hypothetical protein